MPPYVPTTVSGGVSGFRSLKLVAGASTALQATTFSGRTCHWIVYLTVSVRVFTLLYFVLWVATGLARVVFKEALVVGTGQAVRQLAVGRDWHWLQFVEKPDELRRAVRLSNKLLPVRLHDVLDRPHVWALLVALLDVILHAAGVDLAENNDLLAGLGGHDTLAVAFLDAVGGQETRGPWLVGRA